MKPVVALCTNLTAFDEKGLNQPDLADKYPGCGWIPEFRRIAIEAGLNPLSGRQTHALVCSGDLDPQSVLVIQEEQNRYGEALVASNAKPAILFCQESPIYTPLFYDALPSLKAQYKFQMLFDGGTHHLHFPSFDAHEPFQELVPWDSRRPLVLVMAAKHYSMLGDRWIHSPAWKKALETQLQDERFKAIETMHADLYGKGFPNSIPDGQKVNVIRNYRHAICYENGSYPGYITEKIIDCFRAGVIPIYKGAPDVDKYIPRWAYDPRHMHDFLGSDQGLRYSYQGFASDMLKLILELT